MTLSEAYKTKRDNEIKQKSWRFEQYVSKFDDDPEYRAELWERFEEQQIEAYLWD